MPFISANLLVWGNSYRGTSHLCWFNFEKKHLRASVYGFKSVSACKAQLHFTRGPILESCPLYQCSRLKVLLSGRRGQSDAAAPYPKMVCSGIGTASVLVSITLTAG